MITRHPFLAPLWCIGFPALVGGVMAGVVVALAIATIATVTAGVWRRLGA